MGGDDHQLPETGISGRPFRGPNGPQQAYRHLARYHRIHEHVASRRLHNMKGRHQLRPDDAVVIGRTGDVCDARNGERLGTLTDAHWDTT
jgi:hypothetical protein